MAQYARSGSLLFLSKLHRPKKLLKITEDKTRLSKLEDKETDEEELPTEKRYRRKIYHG